MTRNELTRIGLTIIILLVASEALAKVRVVATLTDYAWAARVVGGEDADVISLCPADQDAHFLAPRPSFAVEVAKADLFVATGLDLELWAPVLLDKAGNRKVMPGMPGYVSAARGVLLRDKPATIDRSQGDVHLFGNPHVQTSPLNMRVVLHNIAAGLSRVDPQNAARYEKRSEAAILDLDRRTFGPKLVAAIGGNTLATLALKDKLMPFLKGRKLAGVPLTTLLGGWLGRLASFRGARLVTYHPNWSYLSHLFGMPVVNSIEVKPGVSPSPRHVEEVLAEIRRDGISFILAASYYPHAQVQQVAQRAGVEAAIVPFHVGAGGTATYPDLVEAWVHTIERALSKEVL